MKKRFLALAGLALTLSAPAWAGQNNQPWTSDISYQTTVYQTLKTEDAKVTVQVNGTSTESDTAKLRAQIMQRLNSIAKADWQIVSFQSSTDSSGLEQIKMTAQVRLLGNALNNLHRRASQLSKAGLKITIANIDYSPSQKTLQQAYSKLRMDIYNAANAEVERLDKVYQNRKYVVKNIRFASTAPVYGVAMLAKTAPASQSVAVSKRVTLSADITLSAELNQTAAQ